MQKPPVILEPHVGTDIERFSKTVDIDIAHARYIDFMREHYVRWEHDYIRKSREEGTLAETG